MALLWVATGAVQARSHRVAQIPNGSINTCSNCHLNPGGGGTRNAFGQAVEAGLIGGNVDWNSTLAALDSDGDGFTNGTELQDPNGIWVTLTAAPGNSALVSKPGDASSVPAVRNSAPVLAAIGNKSVDENGLLSFALSASDADDDDVSFSVSGLPSGASLSAATFSWTPGFTQSGAYNLTFTANDGEGATDSESITIIVAEVNRAPELNAIGDQTVGEAQTLNFTLSASDPDDDGVSFAVAEAPAGAALTAATFSWTPTFNQSGIYNLTFTATDERDGVDSETIAITVEDRTPPLGPVSIDFDLLPGDQGRRVTGSGAAGQVYACQLHIIDAPEVDRWRVDVAFDAAKLRYVEGSLRPGGFLSAMDATAATADGLVSVVVSAAAANAGNGELGGLSFEILEGFAGTADLSVIEVELSREGTIVDSQIVLSVASIVSEPVDGLLIGDFDGSGVVDFDDFFLFVDGFGSATPLFDLDRDGVLDLDDFFLFSDHFDEEAVTP